jgi:hypothetical protein
VQEHVVRNGQPVAGFGVGAPSPAEAALHSIRVRLDRPPWGRGVSLTTAVDGSDAVLVAVDRPEHVPIARAIVGDRVNGVPVRYEVVGDFYAGTAPDDFGVGAHWSPTWRDRGVKLAAMDRLIAAGRGDELVEGGGCTEPGGGIVPTQRTARAMAALLRKQMEAGLGHPEVPAAAPPHSFPWRYALAMSLVSTATGWVLEEIARRTFRKKARR